MFRILAYHDLCNRDLTLADETGKLACWRLLLPNLEFRAVHCTGAKQQTADAQSWLTPTGDDHTKLQISLAIHAVNAIENNDPYTRFTNIPRNGATDSDATFKRSAKLTAKQKRDYCQRFKRPLLSGRDASYWTSKLEFCDNNRGILVQNLHTDKAV